MNGVTYISPKISRPARPLAVSRPRLFERLDGARGQPLIWVQGPGGAGKTTLANSWSWERGVDTLWYQLDADDADPEIGRAHV
jgi:ATP/maltotriose-dependent transcriptional regulator MalT